MINEDWEFEFQKDLVYLQEDLEDLKREIYPLTSITIKAETVNESKIRTFSPKRVTKKQHNS